MGAELSAPPRGERRGEGAMENRRTLYGIAIAVVVVILIIILIA